MADPGSQPRSRGISGALPVTSALLAVLASVVVAVPGTHSISATARVREVVSTWLASLPGE